jgi:hypothetical protein
MVRIVVVKGIAWMEDAIVVLDGRGRLVWSA